MSAGWYRRRGAHEPSVEDHLKALLPYLIIIFVGVAIGWLADSKYSGWNFDNWVDLGYGTFVALGLTFIGRRQQSMQEALANLQLREKIGVVEGHALRAGWNTEPLWCIYVASDARAAMHLFHLASDRQRTDMLNAISLAYEAMTYYKAYQRFSGVDHDCVLAGTEALLEEMDGLVSRRATEGRTAFRKVSEFHTHLLTNSTSSIGPEKFSHNETVKDAGD
ncbi:hypothetical protein [Streptosporangium sp. NPDC006930]|uniref:hypothetical protein n=1 Tax=unclassified Streptosporangium TaxID=2632669 RepID=UPI0034369469